MTYYVYQHISPINKVYVGITNNPTIRFSGKGSRYCTYNSIFSKVIKKYGWDNIQHEILISNTTFEKACIIEKALIKFYKKRNISYNITILWTIHEGFQVPKRCIFVHLHQTHQILVITFGKVNGTENRL